MATAQPPSPRREAGTLRRAYGAAYATALTGCLLSAGLTYIYVGNGARELNPVVRTIITHTGLTGMVFIKTGVLVACYHGYVRIAPSMSPRTVLAFAWIGSLVNLANGVYDATVAVRAGPPPLGDAVSGAILIALAAGLGLLLRPGILAGDGLLTGS